MEKIKLLEASRKVLMFIVLFGLIPFVLAVNTQSHKTTEITGLNASVNDQIIKNIYYYNQTSPIINSYGKWFYNMTTAGDATWNYNQTTPFTNWLAGFAYNYNQTYSGSTYNATYATCVPYAYNQTYSGSTYNASYAAKVDRAGDTMTGNLVVNTNISIGNNLIFTGSNKTCYDGAACTKYIYWNGTDLIEQT